MEVQEDCGRGRERGKAETPVMEFGVVPTTAQEQELSAAVVGNKDGGHRQVGHSRSTQYRRTRETFILGQQVT